METAGVRHFRAAGAYKPDLGRGWPVNKGNGESINSVAHIIGNGCQCASVSDTWFYGNGHFDMSVSNVVAFKLLGIRSEGSKCHGVVAPPTTP